MRNSFGFELKTCFFVNSLVVKNVLTDHEHIVKCTDNTDNTAGDNVDDDSDDDVGHPFVIVLNDSLPGIENLRRTFVGGVSGINVPSARDDADEGQTLKNADDKPNDGADLFSF